MIIIVICIIRPIYFWTLMKTTLEEVITTAILVSLIIYPRRLWGYSRQCGAYVSMLLLKIGSH